ncbi:MAG: hypothetical protein GY804_09445 [Alphaproteobacteria bacterium]|nr:hypothetical protein [Alphaproteobacteria bacterium]
MGEPYLIPKEGIEVLYDHIFNNIWNEPDKESRSNILPGTTYKKSQRRFVNVRGYNVTLPTEDQSYFVLYINRGDAPGLKIYNNEWVSGVSLANDHSRLIEIISEDGFMIPRSMIFLQTGIMDDIVLIAIDKQAYKRFNLFDKKIYVSIWRDTELDEDIEITYHNVYSEQDQLELFDAFLNGTMYSDGMIYDPQDYTDIPIGSYTEVVKDSDLKIKFRLDLGKSEENNLYYSDDGTQRQLIHVPKRLNPNQQIITLNTVRIFARKKTESLKGVVINDAVYNKLFTQVTHADFGIPRYIIEDAQDVLGIENIYLEVHIRNYDNHNFAQQDLNYIDQLYRLDDEAIVDILTDIKPTISFWKAGVLELSAYVKAFYDCDIFDSSLDKFIEILGPFHTVSLLSKGIFPFTMSDTDDTNTIIFKKSIICDELSIPLVMEDGLKLPFSFYHYTDDGENVTIAFNSSFVPKEGAQYVCMLYTSGTADKINLIIPDENNHTVTLNYKPEFRVRKTIPITTVLDYEGKERSYYWEELSLINYYFRCIKIAEDTYTVYFNSSSYGMEFVVTLDQIDEIHPTKGTYDVDSLIQDDRPIVINLVQKDINDNTIPIFKLGKCVVWFNRRRLVEDVDYKIKSVMYEDNLITHQLAISSLTYINQIGENIVEVFCGRYLSLWEYSDFAVYEDLGILPIEGPYFQGTSCLYVNGKLIHEPTPVANSLHIDVPEYPVGSPYHLANNFLPASIDTIPIEIKNKQLQKLTDVQLYLKDANPYNKLPIVVIPYEYHLYSIWTQMLCRKMLRGGILPNDPTGIDLDKLFPEYSHLKDIDVVYSGETDWDYEDAYPMLRTIQTTPEIYNYIKTIQGFLPKDIIKDNNTI